jgi:threonine/homoserine/homoserine lactone efflux protein
MNGMQEWSKETMSRLLLSILPLACGAAVSPTLLVIAVVALSSSTKRLLCGWAVILGSALALCCISAAGVFLGATVHRRPHRMVDTVIDLAVVVILVALAAHQLRARKRPRTKPSLTDRMSKSSPKAYLVAGAVAMLLNATSIVLFIPAIRLITKSQAGLVPCAVALSVMFFFLLLPMLVPVGLATLLGKRADGALNWLHSVVTTYTLQITVTVELIFALYFAIKAIIELSA